MTRIILGVETSCDDTSLAILRSNDDGSLVELLALNSFNQDFVLKKWGGVVPEIAAREHVKALPLVTEVTLKEAGIKIEDITEIAVTTHPGLVGSLLTGINFAKTLSLIHELPITSVNHLYAHLEAIHLTEKIAYPYLGLLVSGGHSLIVQVEAADTWTVLGQTLDDAAGEAFDKGGKILGLGYPAGRVIDERAKLGNKKAYDFPISYMRERPGKMSYSGLKTALKVFMDKNPGKLDNEAFINDVCASYQEAIVQTLRIKTLEVVEKILNKNIKTFDMPIVIGGGVAANSRLKEVMTQQFKNIHVVKTIYCADNAAMIANWAARVPKLTSSFPECLDIDAQSRFVEKK